jgi:hypothetical protein
MYKLAHCSVYKWITRLTSFPRFKVGAGLVVTHLGKAGGVIILVGAWIVKKNIGIKLTPSNLFSKRVMSFAIPKW